MIGWLVAGGLAWFGCDPAASEHYAALAEQWTTRFRTAYEATLESGQPQRADLGAAYAAAARAVSHAGAEMLETYRAALRAVPPPEAPVDLGALCIGATDTIRQAYSAAIDAYRTAMRPLPEPVPQPAPQVLSQPPSQAPAQSAAQSPPQAPARPPGPTPAQAVPKAAPGQPELAPMIAAASQQFDLPEPWIRALIRVESAGDAGAVSPKGAMGLTQVMPETYAYLSGRYDLGKDPYAPRDNILAGSAYLREMYDRYGPSGFLAAYNAGPGRYEDFLSSRGDLPAETRRFDAAVRLAVGEALFADPGSRFYEGIAVAPNGELLAGKTRQPLPVAERLALHSLVAKAVERAANRK